MAIDYSNEMGEILEIPDWFYTLSTEQRNKIMNSALTRYESVTISKNTAFLNHWATLIAPYQPKN